MSSESLLDVLWHGLVCSSWTISVTADTHIRLQSRRKNADTFCVLFNTSGIFKKGLNAFTFQGIPGESELVNNVSGNVSLDALAHLGLTFCSF